MPSVKTPRYLNSASSPPELSSSPGGRFTSAPPPRERIADAERKGNLVIAGFALCLLALAVVLALP